MPKRQRTSSVSSRASTMSYTPYARKKTFKKGPKKVVPLDKRYVLKKNVERKFFDTTLSFDLDSTAEVASTAATGLMCLVPQGDTESTRDGFQLIATSLQIKGRLFFAAAGLASATLSPLIDIWVVQQSQANGAVGDITDIFDSTNASIAMRDRRNLSSYKILHHFQQSMTPLTGVTTAWNQLTVPYNVFVKLPNVPITYKGTTGAIAEIETNNIYLVYGSTNGDDVVSFAGQSRLNFTDI